MQSIYILKPIIVFTNTIYISFRIVNEIKLINSFLVKVSFTDLGNYAIIRLWRVAICVDNTGENNGIIFFSPLFFLSFLPQIGDTPDGDNVDKYYSWQKKANLCFDGLHSFLKLFRKRSERFFLVIKKTGFSDLSTILPMAIPLLSTCEKAENLWII